VRSDDRSLQTRAEQSVTDWQAVEVLSMTRDGDMIVREIDRQMPGIWLAKSHQIVLEQPQ